jgi:hypothetical protein
MFLDTILAASDCLHPTSTAKSTCRVHFLMVIALKTLHRFHSHPRLHQLIPCPFIMAIIIETVCRERFVLNLARRLS